MPIDFSVALRSIYTLSFQSRDLSLSQDRNNSMNPAAS
jgi:hypothetical protein